MTLAVLWVVASVGLLVALNAVFVAIEIGLFLKFRPRAAVADRE